MEELDEEEPATEPNKVDSSPSAITKVESSENEEKINNQNSKS